MRFQVHDVGHGLCLSLIHENGNVMVWDCGHADWGRPSEFLRNMGVQSIQRFFVTNYDQDHLSDLPNLRNQLRIEIVHRNGSISQEQLRAIKRKSGPISGAMEHMLAMMADYCGDPPALAPVFTDVAYKCYCNPFGADFSDTNNISLATFLQCRGTRFLIPGDLEAPGWRALLRNQNFISDLQRVNVLIASHHGRESGYCAEVFDYCSPSVIVFSDGPIVHATQEMSDAYARHATGIQFNGEKRYVLSTRRDGTFWWDL